MFLGNHIGDWNYMKVCHSQAGRGKRDVQSRCRDTDMEMAAEAAKRETSVRIEGYQTDELTKSLSTKSKQLAND